MSLQISTVADSISKLSITGLSVYDIDNMPADAGRNLPCVLPAPNFITGFIPEVVSIDRQEIDFTYTLNYRLLGDLVGVGRGIHEMYPILVDALEAFLYAIVTNHAVTGLIDLQVANVTEFGVVTDPAGNEYHGCNISLTVLEFK